MTPTETAATLRHFNDWRRGDEDIPQFDPREIGEVIDAAAEMIDRLEEAETAWKEADKACRDLTEKVIPNLRESLEAAEKEIALKERVIDALGSELNAVANERDALRAKIAEMEQQEPVRWFYVTNGEWNCYSRESPPEDAYDAGSLMALYALPGAKGE